MNNTVRAPRVPQRQPNPSVQTPVLGYNPLQAQAGTIPSAGFAFTLLLIYLTFNRIVEFLPSFVTAVRPILILLPIILASALLSGTIRRLASSPISILLLLFTAWGALTVPFSVWIGGSTRVLVTHWLPALLSGLVIIPTVVSLEQYRKACYAIALGAVTIVGLSFFLASTSSIRALGRLGFDTGTLGNSNDLAAILLMGVPFCLLAAKHWRGLAKLAALGSVLIIIVLVVRTGSRSGLLALLLLITLLFLRGSIGDKVQLLLVSCLVGILAVASASRTALDRYRTLVSDSDMLPGSRAEASAIESTMARSYLLKRSIWQTVHHPILGVGFGMFMVAESHIHDPDLPSTLWRQTHNTYTQLSSETGIPGLLLYGAAMFFCFRKLRAIRKATRFAPELKSLEDSAVCLWLSLIVFAVTGFFGSNAYYCYFPTLAALTVCLDALAWDHIRASQERAVAAVIPRPVPPGRPAPAAVAL